MFATFKMDLPRLIRTEEYYRKGLEIYNVQEQSVKPALEKYLSPSGELKASKIEKDWFPDFKADVFLSHSHKDEKDVIAFAGFLSDLGLTAFIDSCVWGYAEELLKQIDNKYCVSQRNSDGSIHSYIYENRNQSTAHVHMLLNGALMKMMDRTECVIFLETPNSLKAKDISTGTTNSGWIYSELLMSGCLQKKEPIRKSTNFSINKSFEHNALSVEYDADISHLIMLSITDIVNAEKASETLGVGVLDQLYLAKKLYEEK